MLYLVGGALNKMSKPVKPECIACLNSFLYESRLTALKLASRFPFAKTEDLERCADSLFVWLVKDFVPVIKSEGDKNA